MFPTLQRIETHLTPSFFLNFISCVYEQNSLWQVNHEVERRLGYDCVCNKSKSAPGEIEPAHVRIPIYERTPVFSGQAPDCGFLLFPERLTYRPVNQMVGNLQVILFHQGSSQGTLEACDDPAKAQCADTGFRGLYSAPNTPPDRRNGKCLDRRFSELLEFHLVFSVILPACH